MRKLALLFICLAAGGELRGTITPTDRGTGNNTTASSTTITVAPSGTMTAGNYGILVLGIDNANGATGNLTTTSYTDSVGNIWKEVINQIGGVANSNGEIHVLVSKLTANFTTGDSLTINLTAGSTSETWALTEAAISAGQLLYCGGQFSTVATSANPTISPVTAPSTGDLAIGIGVAESADTWVADSDTLLGSWSTMQHTAANTGVTGTSMSIITQTKVVTGNQTQIYNPTLTSADVSVGEVFFTETNVNARAVANNNATQSTTTITVTSPMAIGSIGVLSIAGDNSNTNGSTANFPTSITDSKSNTWTLRQTGIFDNGTANQGVEIGIYTSVLTSALVFGDTLTCTYQSTTVIGKAWTIWEFPPLAGGTMSYVTGGIETNLTGTTTQTPSITTGSIPNGDYVVGACGAETVNAFVGDSDTTNGTWSVQATSGAYGGAGSLSTAVTSQWKKVTATATQTYNVDAGSSVDTHIGWIEINESAVATTTRIPSVPSVPSIGTRP